MIEIFNTHLVVKLYLQLGNDHGRKISAVDIIRDKYDAKVAWYSADYFTIEFKDPKKEILFRLKYSEYL